MAAVAVLSAGLAAYTGGSSGLYVVRPGDSLWSIAVAHGTTVAELASINHLDPDAILLIGRRLSLPGVSRSQSAQMARWSTGPAASPSWFCSSLPAPRAPWGVLPDGLAASPSLLALRPVFERWASHYGLSAPLLEAVAWQESGWQQWVVSPTGAIGIGQIEPGTARFISSVLIGQPMNVYSVSDNIRMAAAFLTYLAGLEGNNRCATIAAYYEGPLNLLTYGVLPSTQIYVADVEALANRFD